MAPLSAPFSLTRQLKHRNDNDLIIYEALQQIYWDVNLVILHMSYKCISKVLFVHVLYLFCLVDLEYCVPWLLSHTLSSPANIEMFGWLDNSFCLSLHWEGGEPMFKKKEEMKKKTKAPTYGHCEEVRQKTPFHRIGYYSTLSPGQL